MRWHEIQTAVKTAIGSVVIYNKNVKGNKWILEASTEVIGEAVNTYCLEWLGHFLMFAHLPPNSMRNDGWCTSRFEES